MTTPRRIIVGISGASGAIYGIRLLQALRSAGDIETHLIISRTAQITIAHETDFSVNDVQAMADAVHSPADLSACVSSGSYASLGMVIAPCSMRSLAEVALGMTSNLLTRAADVCLKERRRLVMLPRETPLNASHLKNMLAVTEMGGILLPPVPAFYNRPATVAELVDHTVGRTLDLFDIPHQLLAPWEGLKSAKRPQEA
jgi:polyprenyl P-hydroxybenzoate/phenylacrylic acid decarboxylase-like protein